MDSLDPAALHFIFIRMDALCTEIVMVTLKHMPKYLFILGDEEVILGFEVGDDVSRQLTREGEVRLVAMAEACAFDGAWRHIEDAVAGARLEQLHVDALYEDLQCSLGGSIHRKEWRRHEACHAYHHAAEEVGG